MYSKHCKKKYNTICILLFRSLYKNVWTFLFFTFCEIKKGGLIISGKPYCLAVGASRENVLREQAVANFTFLKAGTFKRL